MKTTKLFLIALGISLKSFCQSQGAIFPPKAAKSPSFPGYVYVVELQPLPKDTSSPETDTIVVPFHLLANNCIKSAKPCPDCIVKTDGAGKPLIGKFKKSEIHAKEGKIDEIYSLAGGSLTCNGCYEASDSLSIIKIKSQNKYIITYYLYCGSKCKNKFTKEFWLAFPKAEAGYKLEYNFYGFSEN